MTIVPTIPLLWRGGPRSGGEGKKSIITRPVLRTNVRNPPLLTALARWWGIKGSRWWCGNRCRLHSGYKTDSAKQNSIPWVKKSPWDWRITGKTPGVPRWVQLGGRRVFVPGPVGLQQHEQFGCQLCEQLCEQLREQRPRQRVVPFGGVGVCGSFGLWVLSICDG